MTGDELVQVANQLTADITETINGLPELVTNLSDSVNIERWSDAHICLQALLLAAATLDLALHELQRAGRIEHLPPCPHQ